MRGGPASSMRTVRPRSVNSFATQPPLAPEPTINASYTFLRREGMSKVKYLARHPQGASLLPGEWVSSYLFQGVIPKSRAFTSGRRDLARGVSNCLAFI